ncbi:MAG: restriction endonuclease subunit S [Sphingomonadales bacterium]|nr:restriction endonuclease subunit S [Sphingomonadales bacterium]
MSVPAYSAYKDSEVAWLGKIPAGWSVERFRWVFRESPEKIDSDVVGPMLSVSGYRGIEIKDYDDENRRRLDEDLVGYRIVRPGQLVVNTMWLNYAGLGVSEHEGHVSPAYRSYWIERDVERRYVHHLMRSAIYVQGYTRLLTGIRPNSLQMSRDDLMDFPVLLPPRAEQTAIATFLDRETAKIDALVAEQERLIALLKEKRQAVISHAVTKGLNPNAPMKDSGIEWLGEIPQHWKAMPLKLVVRRGSSISYGIVQPGEHIEGGVPFVQTTNMTNGSFNPEALQKTSAEIAAAYPRSRLWGGEVILGIRASIGACHVVPDYLVGANLSRGVARIECSTEVNAQFLVECLKSGPTERYWQLIKQGSTFNEVSIDSVKNLFVAVPPMSDQLKIVSYCNEISQNFQRLLAESRSAIMLLQERRAALISAAVTGKIDVRGLVDAHAELEAA